MNNVYAYQHCNIYIVMFSFTEKNSTRKILAFLWWNSPWQISLKIKEFQLALLTIWRRALRKGVLPKYTSIWHMSLVLDYYSSIQTNGKLQFKNLVKKILGFMILGARRKQALFTITVDNTATEGNKIVVLLNKTLKRSNIHRPLEPFIYQDTL